MNGRAARRIRRAVFPTMKSSGDFNWNKTYAQLKREYKATPYHKRKCNWHPILTHKQQERRWWGVRNWKAPTPTPKPKPVEEMPFYDDHSRFKYLEGK